MTCDVYFGALPVQQGAGYVKPARPNPSYANPAIAVLDVVNNVSTPVVRDANGFIDVLSGQYQVTVNLYNAGASDATNTTVELWWAQPSTATPLATIAMATAVGATTGTVPAASTFLSSFATTWNVDTSSLATTNGGHVCLWARAYNQGSSVCATFAYDQSNPFGDWYSAVQNVIISSVMMFQSRRWSFGFLAGNPSRFGCENVLSARALDPLVEADRERLVGLSSMQRVRSKLGRCTSFGVPASVSIGLGRETLQAPPIPPVGGLGPAAAIGNLGPLRHDLAEHLLGDTVHHAAGKRPAEYRAHLAAGQIQHAVVQVEPHGDAGEVHAVEINHMVETPHGAVFVGGLVVLFAPQCL